jgi:hypothetical protein
MMSLQQAGSVSLHPARSVLEPLGPSAKTASVMLHLRKRSGQTGALSKAPASGNRSSCRSWIGNFQALVRGETLETNR